MKLFASFLLGASYANAFLGGRQTSRVSCNHLSREQVGVAKLKLSLEDVSSEIKVSLDGVTTGVKGLVGGLDNFNTLIDSKYQDSLKVILSEIQTILSEETAIKTEFSKYASKISQEIDQWLVHQNPGVETFYKQVLSQISSLTIDSPEALALSAFVTYTVVSNILTWDEPPPPSKPYLLQRYDPIGAQVYFDGKPLQALARGFEIAAKSLGFALSLLNDKVQYVFMFKGWIWGADFQCFHLHFVLLLLEINGKRIKKYMEWNWLNC
jgi:hypothetical protein